MADRMLFIGWGTPVRGREERGLEVFNESIGLYGRMQQEGRIEKFDVVLLDPNANLAGYIELHGSSGSRGGCPPRLPQNRACAVHTRLLGTAGYEPRRRPLSTTSIYPHSIASCPWVGATISSCQSRCSATSESSPRSVKNRVRRALSTCGIWLSAHRDLRPV